MALQVCGIPSRFSDASIPHGLVSQYVERRRQLSLGHAIENNLDPPSSVLHRLLTRNMTARRQDQTYDIMRCVLSIFSLSPDGLFVMSTKQSVQKMKSKIKLQRQGQHGRGLLSVSTFLWVVA